MASQSKAREIQAAELFERLRFDLELVAHAVRVLRADGVRVLPLRRSEAGMIAARMGLPTRELHRAVMVRGHG